MNGAGGAECCGSVRATGKLRNIKNCTGRHHDDIMNTNVWSAGFAVLEMKLWPLTFSWKLLFFPTYFEDFILVILNVLCTYRSNNYKDYKQHCSAAACCCYTCTDACGWMCRICPCVILKPCWSKWDGFRHWLGSADGTKFEYIMWI